MEMMWETLLFEEVLVTVGVGGRLASGSSGDGESFNDPSGGGGDAIGVGVVSGGGGG